MTTLHTLTRDGRVWSGQHWRRARPAAHPSGYAELDTELPGGGWPVGAITELLLDRPGLGELRLLLPALARLSHTDERWQVWFNPPQRPNGPALSAWGLNLDTLLVAQTERDDDLLWSLEQCLYTGGSQALVAWLGPLDKARMRRLQLAAEKSRVPVFLLRPARFRRSPSVAALRLALAAPSPQTVHIDILKRRAGWPLSDLAVPVPPFAPEANDD